MKTVLTILIMLYTLPFALCVVDRFKGTHYSCSLFGWHNGNGGNNSFDGCSVLATCSKCGKEVMQDSQGNWF